MSNSIATYSFLPWLRLGIANKIVSADMDASVKVRTSIEVNLDLIGEKIDGGTLTEKVSRNVSLYGPGDIVGIDKRAIVKAEPQDWITNFESNYLPYIEFYDEDFPWRYTPAAPDMAKDRLRPWMMLVVLKEEEFENGKNIKDKPLPYVMLEETEGKFPPSDQLWAWAHVHVNEGLMEDIAAKSSDKDKVIENFQSVLDKNPDLAYSRIMCPRKLEPNTSYHAFLMPSFETGRLAGLGLDPSNAPFATFSASENYTSGSKEAPQSFPYYHRWYFKTGTVGDFEYLVGLLEPKPVDSRVGRRDMDVQDPGSNIQGIKDDKLAGVLRLEGALQVPFNTLKPEEKDEVTMFDQWDQDSFPHPFQEDLADFINLSDDYTANPAGDANSSTNLPDTIKDDPDPLITPPIYGKWHALISRILKDRENNLLPNSQNWVHQLNLDPRYRATAGFGTHVVQENQEKYMNAAWKQVGDILEANRKMRQAQLAKETSYIWYDTHLKPIAETNEEKALFITAPVQKRILANGLTVYHQLDKSKISTSVTSITMRKLLKPNGRMMKKLHFSGTVSPGNLLERINRDEVSIAPPKVIPPALPKTEDLQDVAKTENVPPLVGLFIDKQPTIKYLLLIIATILFLIIIIFSPGEFMTNILGFIAFVMLVLFFGILRWEKKTSSAELTRTENQTPEKVDEYPKSPDFKISFPGSQFKPSLGNEDSAEAENYKAALRDSLTVLNVSEEIAKEEPRQAAPVGQFVEATFAAIDPEVSIPKMILNNIHIPARIKLLLIEEFIEAMAYPEFDMPMYKPLVNISTELFLPNIQYISQNSISLLETNQKFIEAYMVGLNHEFSRELLWREFPTDQRGSYFRQFWDASSFYEEGEMDMEELKEKLKDIPPLHEWSKFSSLGDHDHREEGTDNEEELVLAIRGELLKKYPNAVIYAQKAQWQTKGDGTIDSTKPRELISLTESEQENPPKSKLKTPLYEAKIDPDIYFFGFDLTASEAKGGTGLNEDDEDKPGWFFVIKERPGEPRFGLDINEGPSPNLWNDLSWNTVLPEGEGRSFIEITADMEAIPLGNLGGGEDQGKQNQQTEDKQVSWNKDMNAAEMAYILYQVPVLVAVHASEMLPK